MSFFTRNLDPIQMLLTVFKIFFTKLKNFLCLSKRYRISKNREFTWISCKNWIYDYFTLILVYLGYIWTSESTHESKKYFQLFYAYVQKNWRRNTRISHSSNSKKVFSSGYGSHEWWINSFLTNKRPSLCKFWLSNIILLKMRSPEGIPRV